MYVKEQFLRLQLLKSANVVLIIRTYCTVLPVDSFYWTSSQAEDLAD